MIGKKWGWDRTCPDETSLLGKGRRPERMMLTEYKAKWKSSGLIIATLAVVIFFSNYYKNWKVFGTFRSFIRVDNNKTNVVFNLSGAMISIEPQDVALHGIVNSKLVLEPMEFPEKAIYLLETSGRPLLSAKQLCSVESAARHNPENPIVVLVAAQQLFYPTLATLIRSLHPNVRFRHLDFHEVLSNSALSDLNLTDTLKRSRFITEHASDLLRFAILHQHGGIYMDLDTIVMTRFPNISNGVSTAASNGTYLNGAFLIFQKGHPVLLDCMNDIKSSFDTLNFNGNGPQRITDAMRKWCHTPDLEPNTTCGDVFLFPSDQFSFVDWSLADAAFDEFPENADEYVAALLAANATVLHYYNDRSCSWDVRLRCDADADGGGGGDGDGGDGGGCGGNSAVARMAKIHCPIVTGFSGEWLWGFPDSGPGIL
ncbi:unnamed protein product [Notodromas monacha]|uniref:Alpha 1,4-glycosyltransferase domain-containing protein n=1 Tax=Notodromas monacha TaxID=399045 RepID=A0A7R9BVP4_9CRUS|nr:unnamed protein product [Notodromas monacha]CAG0921521.1 unnamed protein product [Notodromas monacha]